MIELLPFAFALWLGLQTALSPCPLTGNIAAMSFLARRVDRPMRVLGAGLLFAAGQMLAYSALAGLIVSALIADSDIATALQRYVSRLAGPLLVATGVFVLGLVPLPVNVGVSERLRLRAEGLGLAGALVFGVLLALAFCPTTAALYFGQLIPMSIRVQSSVLLPATFALGATLPVLVFAFLIAFAANRVGTAFGRLAAFERWFRGFTGVLLIAAGVYLTMVHVYGVLQ
jgi:cytochrome c-type biogenesis protein